MLGDAVDRVGSWRILPVAMINMIAFCSDTFTTCFATETLTACTIRSPQPRSDLEAIYVLLYVLSRSTTLVLLDSWRHFLRGFVR